MTGLHFIPKSISKQSLLALLLISLFFYPVYHGLHDCQHRCSLQSQISLYQHFFAKREPEIVLREDLSGPERFIFSSIDYNRKSVSTWFPGIIKQQAFYLDGVTLRFTKGLSV